MNKRCLSVVVGLVSISPVAHAYESEIYVSSMCGISMAIPAGHRASVSETMGADGFCKVDLNVEGVEFHGVTEKGTSVTLPEAQQWVVRYTGIASDKWYKFDEGKAHVGYKAAQGGKTVWAATTKGTAFSCMAYVGANTDESEADLKQFYDSLSCH